MTTLITPRLRLEPFCAAHLEGLHALNSIPEVMRYITGKPETREETAAAINRVAARWAELGFSWWSFIERSSGELIGAGCVQHLAGDAANPLELGWRLRPDRWQQGLASEAARHMAAFAFDTLATPTLLAVCHPDNRASAKVMERLGMHLRGEEYWYDMQVLVHEISRTAWLRSVASP